MPLSVYLQNKLLEALLRNQAFTVGAIWLSLHERDPGFTGAGEFSGNGYRRQAATFRPAQAGTTGTTEVLDFPDMPAGDVVAFGLWDSAEGGQFLGGDMFLDVRSTQEGDTFRIPAGNVTIGLGA